MFSSISTSECSVVGFQIPDSRPQAAGVHQMPLKKIRPALYAGPRDWGWSSLTELASVLEISPYALWTNFGPVSEQLGDERTSSLMQWWNPDDNPSAETAVQATVNLPAFPNVMLPAGFCTDVLKLHQLGAVRAGLVKHVCNVPIHECPHGGIKCLRFDDTPNTGYAIVGYKADGSPVDSYAHQPVTDWERGSCTHCFDANAVLDGHEETCALLSERARELVATRSISSHMRLDPFKGHVVIYYP